MDFGAAVTVCGPSMTVRWATKANSVASEAVMVRQPLDMKFPLFRSLKDTESRVSLQSPVNVMSNIGGLPEDAADSMECDGCGRSQVVAFNGVSLQSPVNVM